MDKFFLLPQLNDSFDTTKLIEQFDSFKSWNVNKIETIGDRGVLLHIKKEKFIGYILISLNGDQIYVRKINKCGMVLMTNHTKYLSIVQTILNLYLAD